ncbi:MAG: sensor histidine kinase [Mycobacteriales bacterium]
MTRRILVSFLAVLLVLIAAVIVPLGITVSGQRRDDFRDSTRTAARAFAAVAEEHLDDQHPRAVLPRLLRRADRNDDQVAVLGSHGALIATDGDRLPAAVVAAVRAGKPAPDVAHRLVVSTPIGDADRRVGTVILSRSTGPLDDRARALWLALGAAALAALAVGAAVGWSLGRWISRPLGSLIDAARAVGTGRLDARADQDSGPAQTRHVARAFNDMAERVGSLLDAQRGMTAEVSHQLRTPLAALRLRLELMAGETRADLADDISTMLNETSRLSRLVDGLLAVARAEATTSAPISTNVVDIVNERLTAWEPVATERAITLEYDAGGPSRAAAVTPGHLEQVLDNLLANAVEALPRGGRITVTVGRAAGHVVLQVDDTGPGMDPEQQAHAFDRYSTDRGGRGGTGLGLAIVGRLVATDHGTAAIGSAGGGGTRIEIRLPCASGGPSGQSRGEAR